MGYIRDRVDLASVARDQARAARAGGPRQIAKDPGPVRGSDRFPARRIRLGESEDGRADLCDFTLFGPTCDSADEMKGPFRLPADMREGDWIELGQLGAYGACLSSRFNGFGGAQLIEVADPPMLSTP